jgi:hypothetical protein
VADDYSFRQRFELVPGSRLQFSGVKVRLDVSDGVEISMHSVENKDIQESDVLAIQGRGFKSEDAARAAGERWRDRMQRALAGIDVGANFGLRNPVMGGLSDYAIDKIARETGQVILRDSWDVLVFPSEPRPVLSSMAAVPQMLTAESVATASIAASTGVQDPVNEVAFDLFSASMRAGHMADVRLVLLVMAIECLIERSERGYVTKSHIDELVELTLTNDALEEAERESLANALRGLKSESTRKGARTLSEQLEASRYGQDPAALIDEGFRLRNALVHGRRRPDLDRVRYVGASLERMVGDLVAGAAVVRAVAQARLDLK